MNVAILATFICFWGRLFNLRFYSIQAGILLIVFGYLCLTDGSPPLIRPAILLGFSRWGQMLIRSSHPFNGLFFAASLILLWNPADLFDIKAQLLLSRRPRHARGRSASDRVECFTRSDLVRSFRDLTPHWQQVLHGTAWRIGKLYLFTLGISISLQYR